MEVRKFVVKNPTRDSKVSASVTSVNAALEPLKVLKVLIEGLPGDSRTGLWLTNFKGVPVARTLSPFDLVYLDKENVVLQAVALSKDGEFAPFKGRPASALVLPPGSVTQSQTREGDRLEFEAAAAEIEQTAEAKSSSPAATPAVSVPVPEPILQPSPEFSQHFLSSLPLSPPSEPQTELKERQTTEGAAPSTGLESAVEHSDQTSWMQESAAAEFTSQNPQASSQAPPSAQDFFTPSVILTPPREGYPAKSEPIITPLPDRLHVQAPPAQAAQTSSIQISQPSLVRSPSKAEPTLEATAEIAPSQEVAPTTYRRAPTSPQKYSWKVRLLRWLFPHLVIQELDEPEDRRRADRQSLSGLVAYYFTGGSPAPQRISNISVTGFYLQTDERWMPGTVVRMTLQRLGSKGDDPADTITVNSRIVRWGADGEGFEFILTDLEE
jgi:hypothetical protein